MTTSTYSADPTPPAGGWIDAPPSVRQERRRATAADVRSLSLRLDTLATADPASARHLALELLPAFDRSA
ncbi:MAG TPA: hypothetical protein VGG78_04865, partial [Gemmatimonadaceae bacterium]